MIRTHAVLQALSAMSANAQAATAPCGAAVGRAGGIARRVAELPEAVLGRITPVDRLLGT